LARTSNPGRAGMDERLADDTETTAHGRGLSPFGPVNWRDLSVSGTSTLAPSSEVGAPASSKRSFGRKSSRVAPSPSAYFEVAETISFSWDDTSVVKVDRFSTVAPPTPRSSRSGRRLAHAHGAPDAGPHAAPCLSLVRLFVRRRASRT